MATEYPHSAFFLINEYLISGDYDRKKTTICGTGFAILFERLKSIDGENIKALTALHGELQSVFRKNKNKVSTAFENYSDDVSLIISAPTEYKSIPKRDKWIYERFKTVYDIVSATDPSPKFISSFGASHVRPDNSKNITHKLETFKGSPVKGKVVRIGTQCFKKKTQLAVADK